MNMMTVKLKLFVKLINRGQNDFEPIDVYMYFPLFLMKHHYL